MGPPVCHLTNTPPASHTRPQTIQACRRSRPRRRQRREKRSFLSREHRAMQFLRSCDMLCSNSVDIMSTGNVAKRAKTTCVLKSVWKTRKNSVLHALCHGEIRVKGVPVIYDRTVQYRGEKKTQGIGTLLSFGRDLKQRRFWPNPD